MKNLKSIIQYECETSFKYIWIFYAIQYTIIGLIISIVGLSKGTFESVSINGLELNTLVYVGILGVLGFKVDFKMLLQNGFTRKYIFISTFSMFVFISGIMALIDTIVGNLLHYFNNNLTSVYGGIYGYNHLFMNWLWLFLLYVVVCSLLYLIILIINKIGKSASIILGTVFGGIVLLSVALVRYVFIEKFGYTIIVDFLMKAMGFTENGTINYVFPVITLLVLIITFGISSYTIIRHTELN